MLASWRAAIYPTHPPPHTPTPTREPHGKVCALGPASSKADNEGTRATAGIAHGISRAGATRRAGEVVPRQRIGPTLSEANTHLRSLSSAALAGRRPKAEEKKHRKAGPGKRTSRTKHEHHSAAPSHGTLYETQKDSFGVKATLRLID